MSPPPASSASGTPLSPASGSGRRRRAARSSSRCGGSRTTPRRSRSTRSSAMPARSATRATRSRRVRGVRSAASCCAERGSAAPATRPRAPTAGRRCRDGCTRPDHGHRLWHRTRGPRGREGAWDPRRPARPEDDVVVALVALAMAVGVVGTVLPLVPGLVLVWAAALAYGLIEGFGTAGTVAFALVTVFAVAGVVAGWVVPARVAGAAGAARTSILLGVVAAIVGFFVIPIVGLPVGGVAGVYAGELQRTRDGAAAWRATRATLAGFGLAALVQFALALGMTVTWVFWVLTA